MANFERTYLELSNDDGAEHKYYEVTVDEGKMSIQYGRIGTDGRLQEKEFSSFEEAKKQAAKKIASKIKKGYELAIKGVRKKRMITRRQVESKQSSAKSAPALWSFKSNSAAFGIFISEQYCMVGNQDGSVFVLNHNGEVINQFRLPDGVKCIVADDHWIYAGCDDGKVYDLTGKLPYVAYEIKEDVDIYWLDICNAFLGVSDAQGNIVTANYEDEVVWQRTSPGTHAWMVRCDEQNVYHGHSNGVTTYRKTDTGKPLWSVETGNVLFGWQTENMIYVGTGERKIHAITKAGVETAVLKCDAAVYSCATSKDDKYIFAGDNCSSIYCFDHTGKRLWKLATKCGSALSMQYFNQKIYIVTTNGSLTCIDASEASIKMAEEGLVPATKDIKAPQILKEVQTDKIEMAHHSDNGIRLKCVKDGSKLRVKVASDGYNVNLNVQFPKNIREEGATYLVENIVESNGGFYRVIGEIKKIM